MKKITYTILLIFISFISFAQQVDVSQMTKEDILELSYDELLEMPFEDVLRLADIVGVSLEELYEMLLNKDVVSASKKSESSFEAPLSTSVVSYDEIISSGARSIEEALRLVPGLIVREKTNGNFDIHIRGNENLPPQHMLLYSENSITLVMIDGRPVYNYVHGGTFWESLPIGLDDVDRIEVVRGPASALYGPNAASGAINIITKTQDTKKLNVNGNIQGGSLNTLISSLSIGKGITDKLSFRVSGNFETLDRDTDKLFVHKAYDEAGGFISKEELSVLPDYGQGAVDTSTYTGDISHLISPQGDNNYYYRVFDPTDNVDEMYPTPHKARMRYGLNGYLFYDLNKDVSFNLKGGYQYSDILSSTMGDNPSSLAGRLSNTSYLDFVTKAYGLNLQANVLTGWQDIVRADTGFKIDQLNVNLNAEYDFNIGNLNIRPGIAYQLTRYDDMPYLREEGQGFLNGEKEFNSTAFSLRLDYLAFERLRLIGALRGEKYSANDNPYISYQLIASYNVNNKHNIRLVHSRANRGPFLVDTYANYLWERAGRPAPSYILFEGQKNLNLLTMNMFELGYRIKPTKSIQADIEAFYTLADNYGALYPDSVNLNFTANGAEPWVRMRYNNLEMKSEQMGLTAEIQWVVNKDLFVKLFGTYQISKITDYIPYTLDETTELMLQDAYFNFLDTTQNPRVTSSTEFPKKRESGENLATPSYYGGFLINYRLLDRININLNSYYYGKQEFRTKYSDVNMKSKLILNTKISYEIKPEAIIFVNIKNILGSENEFAYMDKIQPLFLGGLTINFK